MRLATLALSVCFHSALIVAHPSTGQRKPRDKDYSVKSNYHDNIGVLQYVNPHIGTYGTSPNDNGGMIPSVSVPFGMTRWTPQTRENYISQVPYHDNDSLVHGFQATHQPAIWMGELGQTVIMPGWTGGIKSAFEQRGLAFDKKDEVSTPYVYEVLLDADTEGEHNWDLTEAAAGEGPVPGGAGGVPDDIREGVNGRAQKRWAARKPCRRSIRVAMSALAHTGHLRLDYEAACSTPSNSGGTPVYRYVFIQATRQNWTGHIEVDLERQEISGSNPQRQDYRLGPDKPATFSGYFVSRFSEPFVSYGTTFGRNISESSRNGSGENLGAYVQFSPKTTRIEVRTGISFVSVEQARKNLDLEIPDRTSFEDTVAQAKAAWLEKLGRVTIEGINATDKEHDQRTIWYTGLFHALQYPNDFSEPTGSDPDSPRVFYNGYTDSIHTRNESYYQSWSIWDTYRAEHSLLALFAPERVNGMMRSLLNIFDWSGRLPMWANMVETNIMIATNADVVLANALSRGFRSFNISKAWDAVRKDAYEPPERDTELLYYDREPDTPYEVRAGLTSYMDHGWVDNDRWAESASRTLDYAFNDAACAIVARIAGKHEAAAALDNRAKNYANLWNSETQFMQARNENGSFANETWGWTEGDKWAYTFDVPHDIEGLASLFKGGRDGMKIKLDEHFDGGHNMHSNEPSHHIPYLYSLIGYPNAAAKRIRSIAWDNYNATSSGLSGNEDLGQMSAWYLFSALGFYPINSAGDEYVVGTPFFEKVTIRLPRGVATGGEIGRDGDEERKLVISAPGATRKPYVKGLSIDGKVKDGPVITHGELVNARLVLFEMSGSPTGWGTGGA
ncbi:glycoside hydrolase family 92 protein [Xylaria bambusicola]|uniref:glycoside hydrolase family 92 protein n=1 Tax=Xylaria bambusicola TaxID=326684 RepID=UPI002007DD33|nr:glycoside hydrolase family 92 protein [Xylaria bambusicola]KAI0521394.1 glycoside hydrolase family 92 protein [Xylaria bambusicola]